MVASKDAGYQRPALIGRSTGQGLYLLVEDVDDFYRNAPAAGAAAVIEPENTEGGMRRTRVLDPQRHEWSAGTYEHGAAAAHRALTADPSLKTDWGGHGKFGAWIAQIGQGVQYSATPSPGWGWDATRFSPERSTLASEGRPALEEQVTRVTDVPALSSDQFRRVFLSLESKLREHPGNRSELARSVRDDCVAAGQPVSRSAVNFVIQGVAYAGGSLSDEMTAAELAAAGTRNIEERCRLALIEFDDAEKLALKRWAGGGLLESTTPVPSDGSGSIIR